MLTGGSNSLNPPWSQFLQIRRVQWINKAALPLYPAVLPVCRSRKCIRGGSVTRLSHPPTHISHAVTPLPDSSSSQRAAAPHPSNILEVSPPPSSRRRKITTNLAWMGHPSERGRQRRRAAGPPQGCSPPPLPASVSTPCAFHPNANNFQHLDI